MNMISQDIECYSPADAHDEVCIVCREQLGQMHEIVHSKRLAKKLKDVVTTYIQLYPCVSNNEVELAIEKVRNVVID